MTTATEDPENDRKLAVHVAIANTKSDLLEDVIFWVWCKVRREFKI